MTIAEQVTQLQQDFQEVKQAGINKGFQDGYSYYREVLGPQAYREGYSSGKIDGYNEGYEVGKSEGGDTEAAYQQGVTDGKQAQYDAFWDAYQDNGNRTDYQNCFSGEGWTEDTFKPKYDIFHTGSAIYMPFRKCGITNLETAIALSGKSVTFDNSVMQYAFQLSPNLEVIGGITFRKPLEKIQGSFMSCPKLKRIQTLPIAENATTLEFTNIPLLEDISFTGTIPVDISFAHSKFLSKASIENIFETLSKITSGRTLTLSETAVINAFGSTTADEWIALVAAKSNWTISLA